MGLRPTITYAVQSFQANNKENIKAPRHWLPVGQ